MKVKGHFLSAKLDKKNAKSSVNERGNIFGIQVIAKQLGSILVRLE